MGWINTGEASMFTPRSTPEDQTRAVYESTLRQIARDYAEDPESAWSTYPVVVIVATNVCTAGLVLLLGQLQILGGMLVLAGIAGLLALHLARPKLPWTLSDELDGAVSSSDSSGRNTRRRPASHETEGSTQPRPSDLGGGDECR